MSVSSLARAKRRLNVPNGRWPLRLPLLAMVATAFLKGLTKGEAAEFVNRLFSDEKGCRE